MPMPPMRLTLTIKDSNGTVIDEASTQIPDPTRPRMVTALKLERLGMHTGNGRNCYAEIQVFDEDPHQHGQA